MTEPTVREVLASAARHVERRDKVAPSVALATVHGMAWAELLKVVALSGVR